jgi:hypothetical protein
MTILRSYRMRSNFNNDAHLAGCQGLVLCPGDGRFVTGDDTERRIKSLRSFDTEVSNCSPWHERTSSCLIMSFL